MLQVTVHEAGNSLTLRLDGTLSRPWVRQLEGLLHRIMTDRHKPVIRFDLNGVTWIDDHGKDFLAIMYMEGVELLACGAVIASPPGPVTQAFVPARINRWASAPFSRN